MVNIGWDICQESYTGGRIHQPGSQHNLTSQKWKSLHRDVRPGVFGLILSLRWPWDYVQAERQFHWKIKLYLYMIFTLISFIQIRHIYCIFWKYIIPKTHIACLNVTINIFTYLSDLILQIETMNKVIAKNITLSQCLECAGYQIVC